MPKTGEGSSMFPYKNNSTKENVAIGLASFQAGGIANTEAQKPIHSSEQKSMDNASINLKDHNARPATEPNSSCKLFGISLATEQNSGKRSCTKVHKQGSLVGRTIDLSKLKNYDDLLSELERLFGIEGLLRDPAQVWRILYTDSENDVRVAGDDPWHESAIWCLRSTYTPKKKCRR